MRKDTRSNCPINLSLEIFGDRWTLLVLRDVIFGGARHFRELLASPERISSNVLADRLATLVDHGLLTKADDPSHKQKVTYNLTEQAIQLVPVLAQLNVWGTRHLPVTDVHAARAEVLAVGGPPLWEVFMDELRETHLGPRARRQPAPSGPTVAARMQAACAAALDRVPGTAPSGQDHESQPAST
ncbi:winged helix-turn-helix transcriptional regulator [Actinophytocola algeriensis]|uniref:DNA-binding HxlR family transcriptional regulator n=1 Tax=Actinophytocola algeriensis TaxID=1768010 RepID=A0A7W7Q7Z4_9PSEU|nr:helix-turn-helix domain-containing protein [Actinophytocola algeriensis]MBB4908705.1 DNA-binding HxlR family transcriptional regulator [Actinophytocola algeriensis]MBE1474908.1 DNA-binding HxlR family transcriptional regulator [Actinophytocola algeriensis]